MSPSSSNVSSLIIETESNGRGAVAHTSSRLALKQNKHNPCDGQTALPQDSSFFTKEKTKQISPNIPTSKLDTACIATGITFRP